MIQKKICMVGSFAVGKTSLVQQYVNSIFSEKYLTTLGVKIDKKIVTVDDASVKLMIWDLAGEDEFMKVQMSYLRGSAGILFVVDGTRIDTLDTALELKVRIDSEMGKIPCILIVNKSDLADGWQIGNKTIAVLSAKGWTVYKTSAKNGNNVEEVFLDIATKVLEAS